MKSTAGRTVLLGVPFDGGSSFARGAADGPRAIRAALRSAHTNTFSETLVDTADPSVLDDAGDVDVADESRARDAIGSAVGELVAAGRRPISLGGDHSITYPVVRALAHAYPGLTLLQIDAHPDLYPEFDGSRYSHACPFARIMEERLVGRLVQVAVRAATPVQAEAARVFGVETIAMSAWAAGARPELDGPLYVSLDLDALDPAFAPGVSHLEPGGLSTRDVLSLIQQLPAPVVGADIVELNPARDANGVTAAVAAKCVKELAARMIAD